MAGTNEFFDPVKFAAILADAANKYRAELSYSSQQGPNNFVPIGPLNLTSAPLNPIKLPSPFKSVILKNASSPNIQVKLITHSDADYAVGNAYPLDVGEAVSFDQPVGYGWLTWDAQAGQTVTVFVGVDVEIRSGKVTSVQSGSVQIGDGTLVTPEAFVSVAAGSAPTQLFAASANRIKMMIQNFSGTYLYVSGTNTVTDKSGASPGIEIPPGGSYAWENAGACYGIGLGGAAVTPVGLNQFT